MARILVAVVVVLTVLAAAGALWLAGFTVSGRRQTLDEAFAWQAEHYDVSFYDALDKTDYTVAGDGGYVLHVQLLANPRHRGRYVILSHGYTDNRYGSLKYARIYLDLGYSCVIYDLRGHGLNEPAITTYGLREGRDLAALIADTVERYADLVELGLHGESLGSATTVSALAYGPQVDWAVADCGFADIEGVLRGAYRAAGAPGWLFGLADAGVRVRYGCSLREMRPVDALDDNSVPVLFIHGEDDTFISPANSQQMYERTRGPRELHLVEGAGHAESVLVDPASYRAWVESFVAGRR